MAGKIEDLSDSKIEDFSTVVQGAQQVEFWEPVGRKNKDFFCDERSIMVFWNVKQCPIPSSEIPCVIRNIRSALDKLGFHSPVDLYAYGDKLDQKEDFYKARMCYSVEDQNLLHSPIAKTDDYGEMAVDLITFASPITAPNEEFLAVFMVIPKPDPDSELHRVLKCLESRNHHVLVVKPPHDDKAQGGPFLHSVQSVVECTQGLDGGEPKIRPNCWCD